MTASTNPMFTRRHYIQIANTLKAQRPPIDQGPAGYQWECDVEGMAGTLAADNERFSHEKFYAACGYPLDPR